MGERTRIPSNKSFGLTFAIVFAIASFWPVVVYGTAPYWWAVVVACLFAAVAFVAPRLLKPLNWAWFRLGLALHHIVNPVLMALIYYGAFVPMGFVMRAAGKDLLRLKWQPGTDSYWIERHPPGPDPSKMPKQF
jgi:Saxitoxin biosynthesis operon protein SxtJ